MKNELEEATAVNQVKDEGGWDQHGREKWVDSRDILPVALISCFPNLPILYPQHSDLGSSTGLRNSSLRLSLTKI